MAIRHQPQSEKHPYQSPTTPGLYVDFRNYIIELVCKNTNPRIGPRFWNMNDYWRKKYSRETRGIKQLSESLDFNIPAIKAALIEIILERRIKALVRKDTITLVIKQVKKKLDNTIRQRQEMADKAQLPIIADDYQQRNARLVDTGTRDTFAKLREIEHGQKKTQRSEQ